MQSTYTHMQKITTLGTNQHCIYLKPYILANGSKWMPAAHSSICQVVNKHFHALANRGMKRQADNEISRRPAKKSFQELKQDVTYDRQWDARFNVPGETTLLDSLMPLELFGIPEDSNTSLLEDSRSETRNIETTTSVDTSTSPSS